MDREIKFRGKRVDNDEWVYGSLAKAPTDKYHSCYILTDRNTSWDEMTRYNDYSYCLINSAYPVEPTTVGQFTGLKDKNGVEIYEGDILGVDEKYRKIYGNPVVKIGEYVDEDLRHLGLGEEEIFPLQGVYIETLKGNAGIANDCTSKYFEVIGNICDNPELLGGGASE